MNATNRQTCKVCGRPDKFSFQVVEDAWHRAVPQPFSNGVVCLFCFDALAEARGVNYADSLSEVWFAGDKAVFHFVAVEQIAT